MVLHSTGCGRVGHRRHQTRKQMGERQPPLPHFGFTGPSGRAPAAAVTARTTGPIVTVSAVASEAATIDRRAQAGAGARTARGVTSEAAVIERVGIERVHPAGTTGPAAGASVPVVTNAAAV